MPKVAIISTSSYSIRTLEGFIDRELETLVIPSAPPYSGKGPWKERVYNFVTIEGNRWSYHHWSFFNEDEDKVVFHPTVLLDGPYSSEDMYLDLAIKLRGL